MLVLGLKLDRTGGPEPDVEAVLAHAILVERSFPARVASSLDAHSELPGLEARQEEATVVLARELPPLSAQRSVGHEAHRCHAVLLEYVAGAGVDDFAGEDDAFEGRT